MKLSFATLGCPEWDLAKILDYASEHGFHGVEMRGAAGEILPPDADSATRQRVRSAFERAELEIACIMGYTHLAAADQEKRREEIELTRRYVQLARAVGCPVVRVFGGTAENVCLEEAIDLLVGALTEVSSEAEDAGVRLALETHDAWCMGRNLRAVLDRVDSPAVGACWDVGNSYFVEDPAHTADALQGRVYHVHFKDAVRTDEGQHSTLPSDGDVDLAAALRLLWEQSYEGYLSFEWEKKWEPELPEPEVAFPVWMNHVRKLHEDAGIPLPGTP
jgi:fatty-acyl-CoA synthase